MFAIVSVPAVIAMLALLLWITAMLENLTDRWTATPTGSAYEGASGRSGSVSRSNTPA
jgi:hypothetical protein